MSRHEAGWVPDTQPEVIGAKGHGKIGRHRAGPILEEREAMQGYRLCIWCKEYHFRAYPEFPDVGCKVARCQCWCMT